MPTIVSAIVQYSKVRILSHTQESIECRLYLPTTSSQNGPYYHSIYAWKCFF